MLYKSYVRDASLSAYVSGEREDSVSNKFWDAIRKGESVEIWDKENWNKDKDLILAKVQMISGMKMYLDNIKGCAGYGDITSENVYAFDALRSLHTPDNNKFWNRVEKYSNLVANAVNDRDFFTGKNENGESIQVNVENYNFTGQDYLFARALSDPQFNGKITEHVDQCAAKILAEDLQRFNPKQDNPQKAIDTVKDNVLGLVECTPDMTLDEKIKLVSNYIDHLPMSVKNIPAIYNDYVIDDRMKKNVAAISEKHSNSIEERCDYSARRDLASIALGKFPAVNLDPRNATEKNGKFEIEPCDVYVNRNGRAESLAGLDFMRVLNEISGANGGVIPHGDSVGFSTMTELSRKGVDANAPVSNIQFESVMKRGGNPVIGLTTLVNPSMILNSSERRRCEEIHRQRSGAREKRRDLSRMGVFKIDASGSKTLSEYLAKFNVASEKGFAFVTDRETVEKMKLLSTNLIRGLGANRTEAIKKLFDFNEGLKEETGTISKATDASVIEILKRMRGESQSIDKSPRQRDNGVER